MLYRHAVRAYIHTLHVQYSSLRILLYPADMHKDLFFF